MKKIQIADDEEAIRALIHATLDGPECLVVQASDGPSAIEMARHEKPDLILLDWMMPGMNGLEVLSALRRDPVTARIPVIMLSARGQERDKKAGIASGAMHYLVKPFSPLELLQKVRETLAQMSLPEERNEQLEDVRRGSRLAAKG